MEIVKGNDIKVVWAITKTVDNVNIPEDLSTATNIRFKVWCSGTLISVPDYSVSGNEITFTIKGSVQRTGEYSFEVSYSKGYDARVVYKDAFLVVDLACQANYVKPDDIQVTTLQFYSSISSLYLWQLLDVKKSTTDNSVDKTFDKFYLGYDAKLKQWYGMKIPEETFKLEDMWKALDAENEIIPKSHLDLTGLATQEWVKQQIDNIPTGGGDVDINVVTQLVKDIIGKWFKEDENSDLYVVNKIVDGAEVGRNFYTYGGITAMGKSDGGGGGTGGASSLGQLTNVGDWADTTPTEDRLFIQKAGATHWSSMRLTDIKVDLSNYYTKSETNSAISKAVVDAVTPVQNLLNNHINNADIHVTLAEKTLWNKIAGYFAEDSNQDIFVTNKSDGTPRGFYSNSFVSALGLNTGGGGGGGAGSISLNGTLYESVDGVITLPNLKLAEPTTFKLSAAGNVEVRTPGRTGYYEFWDSGSEWAQLSAKAFAVVGGTSSQFLKADGSVDGNLYALAYNNNPNYVDRAKNITIVDRRNDIVNPSTIVERAVSSYFTIQDTPYANWRSTISVKGWTTDYATWELAGPSHNNNTITNERPYFRYGFNSSWKTGWKPLAFLEDISNVADVYFNGQNIHSDYGHWVVGLIRIGTTDIGDKYISGEMIYRRSNGIYANGSVRFNLIKKYQTTSMFAGVLYVGYGINTDQDAPRLCTFTYQGVKWGGLCWRSAASLDSIKTIIYDNSSTDTPFYVRYYNSQSGEVQNTEINNSISVLGSDIDIFPISSNGKFYTSSGRMDIHSAGNDWAYMRYTTDGRFYDIGLSSSRNTGSAMNGETGNFEIRPNGSSSNGIFVRYSNSSYGRLGVVSRSTQECSISYWNNAPTSNYPLWTVGAGIRNQYSFDWYYHNQGYKATLDSEGKLFVNVRVAGNPYCSLAIGDYDTGLNWHQDGMITFMSNSKAVGHWNYSEGRLYNCYFREPTGNGYATTSMMVNGNGSNLYPGIGFHQPGVTAGLVYFTNSGEFKFRNITDTGYTNVYGGNLIADAGFLYSRYNGIEIKIGAENSSYVHFINNQSKQYYFNNGLAISGTTFPYSDNSYDLGTYSTKWRNIYANRLIGEADKSVFLVANYIGGRQANPQTYFNTGIGIKVAMTGSIKHWNDTLWINGYSGSDVKDMCALHTVRDGTPQMYISTQKSDATSYGTMYLFYTSYNANKSDRPWICSTLNAYGRITTASDIYSQSWVRTVGTTGWYSESYGGGWHMTDSTWIRAYNNKQIYTASTSPDAFHTLGGVNAGGRIYAGSYIETHGGLVCAGVGNSGGASGFNVYASFYGNGQHGGIEIGASDNVFGIGVHSNDHMYWWWTNSGSVGSSSNKSYIMDYGGGSWQFTGNIGATGGITAMTSSDENLKNRLDYEVDYASKLLLLGKVFDFTYNDKALSRKDKYADRNVHTGLSWQKVRNILPTVCGMDKDGYGYINYISPDLISLIAGATQLNTLGIQSILNRTKSLEERVKILERRNEQLELKIKLIQR